MGVPAELISKTIGQTASTGPWLSAVWVLGAFLLWGATLRWADRQVLAVAGRIAKPVGQSDGDETVERIDRRRFLVRLGGATAVVTAIGAAVGELSEGRRKGVGSARAKNVLWSSTHPLPNADAGVKPVPGTRPEFTPLERHYRIDINTIASAIDPEQWRLNFHGLVSFAVKSVLTQLWCILWVTKRCLG